MQTDALSGALRETLAVFEAEPPGVPLTTTEVAAALDHGRRATYDRLTRLAEPGYLATKAVGARGRVWWLPPEADRAGGLAASPDLTEQSFRSLVEAVEEYAIFLLTPEGRVASWNLGAARIKGYEHEEIVGEPLATFYTDEDVADGVPERNLAAAAEAGSVEDEGWRVRKDGSSFWASVTITAIHDDGGDLVGYTKVTRDLTDRRAFEERLRHQQEALESELDEVFERIDEAFFALDDDWRFTYVNQQAADLVQQSVGELLGTTIWESFPEVAEGRPRRRAEAVVEEQRPDRFDYHSATLDRWLEVSAYPSASGLSVHVQDVTERKRREWELERYETIVETVDDGIYVVDSEGRFTLVNEAYAEMTGYPRGELQGAPVSLVIDEETAVAAQEVAAELHEGDRDAARLEATLSRADGDPFRAEATFAMLPGRDEPERVGVVRDVTERVRRERELAQFRRMVETVQDGVYATDGERRFVFVNDAFVSLAGVPRDELLGAPGSMVFGDRFVEPDDVASWELDAGERDQVAFETRLATSSEEPRWVQNRVVPLELGAETGQVGVTRDVTERVQRERERERQRNRLEALDTLNTAVRDVTDAVLEQTTRAEIERAVCDRLSATASYEFAWIGELDPTGRTVEVTASAGAAGYFDDVSHPIDPEQPRREGTIGRAVRSQELQATTDVGAVSTLDGWPDLVEASHVRSAAAVPLVHGGTLFGVLGVYSARAEAFTGPERDILAQLGEVVGHAITALERKRALMSEEVVELAFLLADLEATLGIDAGGATVDLDQVVPAGNDAYLAYGTANARGLEVLRELTSALAHWESVERLVGDGETVRYQARLAAPPVLTAVADLGGRVASFVIEDGDASLRVHLPPGADVRRVLELVREQYPAAEMVSRRQRSHAADEAGPLRQAVLEPLTDRQAAVLRAAYRSGFFEQPRLNSGEEVAEALGISTATFHQHLRAANRKLVSGLLGASSPGET